MAFSDVETGASTAEPLELFEFTTRSGTVHRFTSNAKEKTSNGETYLPRAVKRGRVQGQSGAEYEALEVSLPFEEDLARQFIFDIGEPQLSLVLYRAHRSDPDSRIVLWRGDVLSYNVEDGVAKFQVPPGILYKLRTINPWPRFQVPCNHRLFDGRCGLAAEDFQHESTVASVDGVAVELASSGDLVDDVCTSGEMAVGDERRMIVGHEGTTFLVNYPFYRIEPADVVTVRWGCDRSLDTCHVKFDNAVNYGGYPLVPDRNPFASKL